MLEKISNKEIEISINKLVKELQDYIDLKSKVNTTTSILFLCNLNGGGRFMYRVIELLDEKYKHNIELQHIITSTYIDNNTKQHPSLISKNNVDNLKFSLTFIFDDIIDTGNSLQFIREKVLLKNDDSVKCVVLIKKRKIDFDGIYALEVDTNKFLVGYGMDNNGKERCLDYIKLIDNAKS